MRRTRSDLLQFLECEELSLDHQVMPRMVKGYLPLHGTALVLGDQYNTREKRGGLTPNFLLLH